MFGKKRRSKILNYLKGDNMPVPIIPSGKSIGNSSEANNLPKQNELTSGVDLSMLGEIVKSESSKNNMKLSDSEASLLFRVWRDSDDSDNDNIIVPDTISSSDILRLKTLGLVCGDDIKKVKFTQRAKHVIKSLVLNEENSFESKRIHKPYGQILADSEKKGKMRLALGKIKK